MSIGRACVQIPILHEDTHTLTVESVEISVLDTGATRFGGKHKMWCNRFAQKPLDIVVVNFGLTVGKFCKKFTSARCNRGKRIKHKIVKNTVSICWRQVIVANKYLSIFMNFDHTISLSLTISSIDINPRPVNFLGNKNARYIKYLNKN